MTGGGQWADPDQNRAAAVAPRPGRVGVHRLNRTEYGNAIRDLLGLDVDASALLLPDEADEGFDNVAASLSLSSAHLERYLGPFQKQFYTVSERGYVTKLHKIAVQPIRYYLRHTTRQRADNGYAVQPCF